MNQPWRGADAAARGRTANVVAENRQFARRPAAPRPAPRKRSSWGILRRNAPITASSNKSGTTRTFHRLSDALQENINARVWAGIHFRTADLQGARLGKTVARYLHKHYFQPVD